MNLHQLSKNKSLSIALLIVLFTTGCTLNRMVNIAEKEQSITVEPNPLTVTKQNVAFDIKGQIPESLIKENQRYKMDVYYEYDKHARENVGSLNFEFGEFLYENGKPTITKQMSFPYEPKKINGRLMVQGVAIDKENGSVKYTSPKQVAEGLNTTPLLLVRSNAYDFIDDNYKEEISKPASLIFYFTEGNSKLNNTLGNNLEALDKYIFANTKAQEILITAGTAPNEKDSGLAAKRATELEKYYRNKIQTYDYSGKKINIKTKVRPDNLDLLAQRIETSALPEQEKQEAITILKSQKSDKEKLKELSQSKVSAYLQQHVYPGMRTAEISFDSNLTRLPDYELLLLAKSIGDEKAPAEALTEEELQYAATLTPLLDEKLKLYQAAASYKDTWSAYYNLGVVYTQMAQKEYRPKAKQALLEKAVQNLTMAGFRNPTAKIYYSLASAYHLLDKYTEALEYYTYAVKLGGSEEVLQRIFADKAALEIEIGQYDNAIESLRYAGNNYQTNMNLGLSYLLRENYEGAEQLYKNALEQKPNDALAYYSLAIIGARTKDEQMMEDNLKKAVRSDNTYIQKAINDLEFKEYRDSAAYKDALIR